MKKITFAFVCCLLNLFFAKAQPQYYDSTFGTNGMVGYNGSQQSFLGRFIQKGDAFYAVANFTAGPSYSLLKLDSQGQIDPNFNAVFLAGFVSVEESFQGYLGFTADNKLIFADNGFHMGVQGQSDYHICRLQPNGALDTTYGVNGYAVVQDEAGSFPYLIGVDSMPAENLIVTGVTATGILINQFDANGNLNNSVLNAGKLSYSVGSISSYIFKQSVVSDDGASMYIGYDHYVGAQLFARVLKLNLVSGAPDAAFGSNGILTVGAAGASFKRMGKGASGSFFVATATNTQSKLFKFNENGAYDPGFASGQSIDIATNNTTFIRKIVNEDGKITILSTIGYSDGIQFNRFNDDGSIDETFGNAGKIYRQSGSGIFCMDYLEYDNSMLVTGNYLYSSNFGTAVFHPALYKFVTNPLSVPENSAVGLASFYPNPVRDYVTLADSNFTSVELFNAIGQSLGTLEIVGNKVQLDNLPSGNYLLRLSNGDGKNVMARLIKL